MYILLKYSYPITISLAPEESTCKLDLLTGTEFEYVEVRTSGNISYCLESFICWNHKPIAAPTMTID